MILVELYSKEDCYLCEIAKKTLKHIQKSHPFELKEIKIHEGGEYYDQFKERVPVIYINKGFAFQYHVPEQEFITKLKSSI